MRSRANRFAAAAGLAPCPEICLESLGLAPRPETFLEPTGLAPTLETPTESQAEPAALGSAPDREPELPLRLLAHASLSTLDISPTSRH